MESTIGFSGMDLFFTAWVFVVWLLALVGAGAGLVRILDPNLAAPADTRADANNFALLEWVVLRLALGTLVAVWVVAAGGKLGVLGPKWQSLWWSMTLLAVILLWRERPRDWIPQLSLFSSSWMERGAFGLFAFYFCLRFFVASFPSPHGDALLYHLVGPRLWHLHGAIQLDPNLPNALIANSWEYLYVWPVELIHRASPLSELLCVQIFSQWTHLLVGGLATALFLLLFLRAWVTNAAIIYLAVTAGIISSSLQWTMGLAKNDWGVIFWFFAGLYCIRLALIRERRRWLCLGGMFWGLALVAKLNAALVLFPMLLLLLPRFRQNKRFGMFSSLALILPSMALTAALILMRNWQETGTPFFPMFQTWWPSAWVSESWHAHIATNQPKQKIVSLGLFLKRGMDLAREGYGGFSAILGLALMVLLLVQRSSTEKPRPQKNQIFPLSLWLNAGWLSWVLFVISVGDDQEIRYLGAGILLLSTGGMLLIWQSLEKFGNRQSQTAFVCFACLILAATSRLPLHVLGSKHWPKSGVPAVESTSGGDAKLWLRLNAKGNERIIFVADNETYYLLDHPVTILTERPDLDRATRQEINLGPWLAAVAHVAPDARYVLDTRPSLGLSARFNTASDRERLLNATVFQGQTARVIDLKRL